ncbi:Uncharacterized protein conserved in archaea [Methanocella conradii HZ254]|uniref:Uncharacterized protein conserved in archaea n=1 Tax=Methanocella conradii (strain DSM 24694 / JCM 17849 / CGMCC 1.5162 / HZ254) TaxID=1041930 RepID=H8I994_METCZ|nr:archaellum operon transcriptional activator EarA family protein [Methanocella conradii]AFC99512.1 Uncharacterized protein conserved in archaea [Methanocella conradii HZ254]
MEDSDGPDIWSVYRSLKHSSTRKKAFEWVCDSCMGEPEWFSARQIARGIGCSERAVLGALLGDGKRYKAEGSLVSLGIVECRESDVHGYTMLLFSPTTKGLEIFKNNMLKDYENKRR